MNIIYNIDTLQFSKRMQKAGLQPEVVDELAEALQEASAGSEGGFAVKADLERLSTKSDFALLRSDFEIFKKDTIIKLDGVMALGITIITTLIKL